ncbi:hypothetical protein L1049_000141 [Liquidambar formosana]|uniref:Uncharacterized protein n=1 Tax=Liquidambar formosana TaxID=63359 RepID=A0AAP0R2E7_LIQFO
MGQGANKKTALSRESDAVSSGSAGNDMPYDSDRKEKFKMVIGKSKKDGLDPPSKATQPQFGVSVDAAAAAAILQAATRGFKNPNLEILSKASLDGISHGLSSEGGQASSFGSFPSSRPQSSNQKLDQNGEPSVSVPVAKAIAETAARAAASEADSSEACLTREQKLKAERLKRAKMFAAMIKSRDAPLITQPLRGLSVERPESGVSGSGAEVVNLVGKEREGSTVPLEVYSSDKNGKLDRKFYDDECNERRSRRAYRSRSKRDDDNDRRGGDDDDNDDDHDHDKDDEESDHKNSRKKHRSHRSSHHSRDRHKHRRRHSSSKDRESRRRRKRDGSSEDSSSKDRESRRRHRHDDSSEDEHHRKRSHKHRRRSHSEREVELEEGEISAKLSDQSKVSVSDGASREASLDLSNSHHDGRAPSQPSETTEVSDDLRAKIRAMLMATL